MTKQLQRGGPLAAAKELSEHRDRRARELKKEGMKIVGYFHCFVPLEMLTAADILPYRMMGNPNEPLTVANTYIDPANCPYLKSCFDMAMKGGYDFLDGWTTPDSCDGMTNFDFVWSYNVHLPWRAWVNVPNCLYEESFEFFKEELAIFKGSVEKLIEANISDEDLHRAIDLHNEQRALLRRLYDFRKPDPPLVDGSEVLQVMKAVTSLPIAEGNELLKGVIGDIEERSNGREKKTRLLVWGPEMDDPAFLQLIEDCGGNVVADDLCLGTRYFWHDVDKTKDPLDGLSARYLGKVMCPRMIRGKGEGWATRQQDLEDRFGHIARFARDFSADGVILYVMKYCDLHEFDTPDLRDYLVEQGFPVLHLETDYSMSAWAGLRTRIEAFIETML